MRLRKYAIVLCSLIGVTACNYDSEFEELNTTLGGLNDRLELLEGQVEGLTGLVNGMQEIQNRLGTLETALEALPESSGLSSGVADLQERLRQIEEGLGSLDPESGGLQAEIDALNSSLFEIQEELAFLLEENNVYPSDLVITSEAELDTVLEFMGDRKNLIVNGAVLLAPNGYYNMVGKGEASSFSSDFSERLYAVTSRITAILGKKLELGYVGPGGPGDLSDPEDSQFFGFLLSESIPFASIQAFGIDGDLLFPELRTVNGAIYMDEINGNVEMPKMDFVSTLTLAGYAFGDFFGPFGQGTSSIFLAGINGNVSLPSLNFVDNLDVVEIAGSVDVSALRLVKQDLYVSVVGEFLGGQLEEIDGYMDLDYGGGYEFPLLQRVDEGITLVDYAAENPNGAPTLRVAFPALSQLGNPISVRDAITEETDNEFSSATYIEILGFFSSNYSGEGSIANGFGAPLAETVIINGDTYYDQGESVILTDLHVSAPNAEMTLTFDETYDDEEDVWSGIGNLYLEFKTLTAANLKYIGGSLFLIGPADGVANELEVSMPELAYIYGVQGQGGGYLQTLNIASFSVPKYTQTTEMDFDSNDLTSFTAGAVFDEEIDFSALESLTLTSWRPLLTTSTFDLEKTGLSQSNLKHLSITGFTKEAGAKDYYLPAEDAVPEEDAVDVCSNDVTVLIGSVSGGATTFSALETVTLADIKTVEMVGTTLDTFTASGAYAVFNNVNNVITTTNATWATVECTELIN